jgi:hypothetical protein
VLDEIKTLLEKWRAEREQQERSQTKQAELKHELEYFLYHAFDIFEEESESEVVLDMEMVNKIKQDEQMRIEQEELKKEANFYLHHAFDLFEEEHQCGLVLVKEKDNILVKPCLSVIHGSTYGANPLTNNYEISPEYLKLYSHPLIGFSSIVDFSLNHITAEQLENQKLNLVEPTLHWEPGDQEKGNMLIKLIVESQLLRRKEIMRISILQQSTNYHSGIPEYSVWLNQSTCFLEQSLQWKLKEISFVNYMSGDGESGKPTLPWDPGEQQNVVIFAKLKVGNRSAKGTRKCMLLNLPKLMQSLLLPHGSSLSQPNGKVKEAKNYKD